MTANAMQPQEKPVASCDTCHKDEEFDYCFWAKLMVAVPSLPLVAIIAASLFSNPLMQDIAAGSSVLLAIYAAMQIDRMPMFSAKVVNKKV